MKYAVDKGARYTKKTSKSGNTFGQPTTKSSSSPTKHDTHTTRFGYEMELKWRVFQLLDSFATYADFFHPFSHTVACSFAMSFETL